MESFHSYFVFPLAFDSWQYCRCSWNISSYFTLTHVLGLIYICVIKNVIERTRDLIYLEFVATDFSLKIISSSVIKNVIERTRDLIYLKFVAADFSLKIISPSAGENSGDSA